MAQRLVRSLCRQCRRPSHSGVEFEGHGLGSNGVANGVSSAPSLTYEAVGCEACANTGYHGRRGIFELMAVDEDIRPLILKRSSADIIKNRSTAAQGMRVLRDDGWRTVSQGLTTVAEVLRVTQE